MDKLRKIGLWIWNNKERLSFGLLAIVLTVQVYRVMSQDIKPPDIAPPPQETEPPPVVIPQPPPPPATENYASLYEKNPFSYYSSALGANPSQATTEEGNIQLLDIQRTPDGQYAARINTKAAKWYKEGESFESYVLLRIDPEQQQVEVRSEKTGTTITLRSE